MSNKVELTCCECGKVFYTFGNPEGATFNCAHCDALLIQSKGVVQNFHKYLHAEDERWPEDGNGTHSVQI